MSKEKYNFDQIPLKAKQVIAAVDAIEYDGKERMLKIGEDVELEIQDRTSTKWVVNRNLNSEESKYYCAICNKGPLTKSGAKIHQSRIHDVDEFKIEYRESKDKYYKEYEACKEVIDKFITAKEQKGRNDRGQKTIEAVKAYIKNLDKGNHFIRANDIEEDIDGILSARQIGFALGEIVDEDTHDGFEISIRSDGSPRLYSIRQYK